MVCNSSVKVYDLPVIDTQRRVKEKRKRKPRESGK